MALFDAPTHSVNTYTVVSSTDLGGGVGLTYTVAQSAVGCSVNTASAQTALMFAQMEMTVTHTIAFLSSALTTALTHGMKIVDANTSATYLVKGISTGQADPHGGRIPAFVYAHVESHAS